jgi:hypothetical protein
MDFIEGFWNDVNIFKSAKARKAAKAKKAANAKKAALKKAKEAKERLLNKRRKKQEEKEKKEKEKEELRQRLEKEKEEARQKAIQDELDRVNADIKQLDTDIKGIDDEIAKVETDEQSKSMNDIIFDDDNDTFISELPADLSKEPIEKLVEYLDKIRENIDANFKEKNYADIVSDYNRIDSLIEVIKVKQQLVDELYNNINKNRNEVNDEITKLQNIIDKIPFDDRYKNTRKSAELKLETLKNTLNKIDETSKMKQEFEKILDNMDNVKNQISILIINVKDDIKNELMLLKEQINDKLDNIQNFQTINQPYQYRYNTPLNLSTPYNIQAQQPYHHRFNATMIGRPIPTNTNVQCPYYHNLNSTRLSTNNVVEYPYHHRMNSTGLPSNSSAQQPYHHRFNSNPNQQNITNFMPNNIQYSNYR